MLAAKSKIHKKQQAGYVLPVYTRLSDAEESEREKLANINEKNLKTGVQNIKSANGDIQYMPMNSADAGEIAKHEKQLMGSDA